MSPAIARLPAGAGLALLVALVAPAAGLAQGPLGDLKQILLSRPPVELVAAVAARPELEKFYDEREARLNRLIDTELRTFDELRLALMLAEWCDVVTTGHEEPGIVASDTRARFRVAQRFQAGVHAIVERGDADSRAALVNYLRELAPAVRAAPDPAGERTSDELARARRAGFARSLTDDVVRLTSDEHEAVRVCALRALSAINAEPERVAALFAARLRCAADPVGRRAAADGMCRVLTATAALRERTLKAPPVWATDRDVLTTAAVVIHHAPAGLFVPDAPVRLRCAEALRVGAEVFAALFRRPAGPVASAARVYDADEVDAVKDVLRAFDDAGAALAAGLRDPVVEVRLLLLQAMDELAQTRCRLTDEAVLAGVPGQAAERIALVPPRACDPLGKFAQGEWRGAARLLTDPEVRVRRGAVSFLEFFAEAWPAVVPDLVAALSDADCFVRWGAARGLGRFTKGYQPADAVVAVPALAGRLFDDDAGVRRAAAATLAAFGPCAAAAVPELARAVDFGDADNRVAALGVLQSIGPQHTSAALPAVAAALTHPDPRVRRAAAVTLGKAGPLARSKGVLDALRRAMEDHDPGVRLNASDALRQLLVPGLPDNG